MQGPHKESHRYALGSDWPACVWLQMDMATPTTLSRASLYWYRKSGPWSLSQFDWD